MSDFLEKLKKSVEDGYSAIRINAINIKETAGEYSKIAKLKFELYQLNSTREKKMALLGKTVYPYLLENNEDALKTHETLQMLLDEIKNISNQVELLQRAIEDISQKEKTENKKIQDYDKMRKEVEDIEKQIEAHLIEIQEVKQKLKGK
jgi:hypothetical protein